jgi:hypothetical protein
MLGVFRAWSFFSCFRLQAAQDQPNPLDGFFITGGVTQFMW